MKLFSFLTLVMITALESGCPQTATESIWYVKAGSSGTGTSWNSAFGSIQDAVDAASQAGGGEVWVASGIYTSTSSPVVTAAENVSLYGGFGGTESSRDARNWTANQAIIDGSNKNQCIYNLYNVLIDGFTIRNGSAALGGGVYNRSCSPEITNCIFTANDADESGGGMANDAASPSITNCTFDENTASTGGAVYNQETSSPIVTQCTFTGNEGGALYNYDHSSPAVTECVFSNNSTDASGGGICNDTSSSPVISGCAFTANAADVRGGGIANMNASSPTVTGCTFNANIAGYGGGMANDSSYSIVVSSCTFSENRADWGGGMHNRSATPTLSKCTFDSNCATSYGGAVATDSNSNVITDNLLCIGNTADLCGGGFYNSYSDLTLINCTLSANAAPQGGAVANYTESVLNVVNGILWNDYAEDTAEIFNENSEFFTSNAYVTYSCVEGGYAGTGNISASPSFVEVSAGDYHLQSSSPCVDTGVMMTQATQDIEDIIRPQGLGSDMGAYEYVFAKQ